MSRRNMGSQNPRKFSVRLDNELDADLIAWLDAQPHGKRSEAVRDLMRDGLRIQQPESSLAVEVHRALAQILPKALAEALPKALANMHFVSANPALPPDANEAEETYGDQIDQLMGQFG